MTTDQHIMAMMTLRVRLMNNEQALMHNDFAQWIAFECIGIALVERGPEKPCGTRVLGLAYSCTVLRHCTVERLRNLNLIQQPI